MSQGDLTCRVMEVVSKQPVVVVGVAAKLQLSLDNLSGTPVGLAGKPSASTLTLYLPRFYPAKAPTDMKITAPDGWSCAVTADPVPALVLTYTGPSGNLGDGQSLLVTIDNAVASGTPGTDGFRLDLQNISGDVSQSFDLPFALKAAPVAGNPQIGDFVNCSAENQGIVYRSLVRDPLANTIRLNIKYTGATALCSDTTARTGSSAPRIVVGFVCGGARGALLPADAAWKIEASIQHGAQWSSNRKSARDIWPGSKDEPVWVIEPSQANTHVLTAGDQANLVVQFSKIVTPNDAGHTQMMVHFQNLPAGGGVFYDDAVQVLDLLKQDPPLTRGLLDFFATAPVIELIKPDPAAALELRWRMFGVAQVALLASDPGIPRKSISYSSDKDYLDGMLLSEGSSPLPLPGLVSSRPIILTLQAFDGAGNFLNSRGFTVYADIRFFEDPYDGTVYPAAAIGRRMWMTQDLRRSFGGAARPVGYYKWDELSHPELQPPAPWRVPSRTDWEALVLGAQMQQSDATAQFKPRYGGFYAGTGDDLQDATKAYYWSVNTFATAALQAYYTFFLPDHASPSYSDNAAPTTYAMPIRWVRDL